MTYSDEAIRRQLRLGEDSSWEFKAIEFAGKRPKSPRRDDWADEISAFANTNGGVLLCGVTDDGDVPGHVPRADGRVGAPAIRSVLGLNISSNQSHWSFARSFPSASRSYWSKCRKAMGSTKVPAGAFTAAAAPNGE